MKKLFLFVALFTWIGFSASAQVQKEDTKKEEKKGAKMDQNKHHWMFKDGKVMEMKDGMATEMTTETQVGDVWIRTNGEVVQKDNKVVQLKAGQYVDEEGMIHTMMRKKKTSDKKMPPPKVEDQL